jgi:hypothetical protein
MPLGLYGVNYHVDRIYGSGTPATLYVAVMLEPADFLDEGTDLAEPVGNGYARAWTTNDEVHWPEAADGLKSNGVDIIFPTATGVWGNIRYWAILDAATGGNVLVWGGTTTRLVLEGGALRFPVDTLTITAR